MVAPGSKQTQAGGHNTKAEAHEPSWVFSLEIACAWSGLPPGSDTYWACAVLQTDSTGLVMTKGYLLRNTVPPSRVQKLEFVLGSSQKSPGSPQVL